MGSEFSITECDTGWLVWQHISGTWAHGSMTGVERRGEVFKTEHAATEYVQHHGGTVVPMP